MWITAVQLYYLDLIKSPLVSIGANDTVARLPCAGSVERRLEMVCYVSGFWFWYRQNGFEAGSTENLICDKVGLRQSQLKFLNESSGLVTNPRNKR